MKTISKTHSRSIAALGLAYPGLLVKGGGVCVAFRVASAICRSAWPAWVWKQRSAALTFSIVQTWKRKMRRTHSRTEMAGQCHQRSEKLSFFNALIHCKALWEYLFGVKFSINNIHKLRTSLSLSLEFLNLPFKSVISCGCDTELSSPIVCLWMKLTMSFHSDSSRQDTPSFPTSHLSTGCRSLDCALVVHLKKCSSQLLVQNLYLFLFLFLDMFQCSGVNTGNFLFSASGYSWSSAMWRDVCPGHPLKRAGNLQNDSKFNGGQSKLPKTSFWR